VGSPRELLWELYQFLAGRGYEFASPYEPLQLEQAPIEGTATFESSIEGHRDFHGRSSWRLILCITILLIPLGIWLIKKSKHMLRDVLTLQVEGEAYRASARTQDPHHPQSEVQDIASSARIILDANLRFIRAGKLKEVKTKSEWERLQTEFDQLRGELDKLIPKIALPKAISDSELQEGS